MLAKSPLWQTEAAENSVNIIVLPMPDGSFQRFRILEAPVMHPDLQAQFPDIRSYAGIGIEDPAAYFRGDFTLRGFHGMIRSPEHSTVFIDPFSTEDLVNYQVYYRKDSQKTEPWTCHFEEISHEYKPVTFDPAKMAGDCVLRNYSLALACTGEYATFHGGTVPLVVSAFNTTMTRVNGVFEKEASVHMTLVANNNNLIFLDPVTDGYTNSSGSTMLAENQTKCDAVIGNANYDIGHVFSTGGGGIAGLGVVCLTGNKARGVTGSGAPIGDAFDIDYVAHEMGHQFNANHTQCNACQRNNATSMEPGSASTIMGYAGICTPNVQNNSDDYFHAISLQEIATLVTGSANACSSNSSINTAPTANAGPDYVIPRSTPFILTGVGSDPNSDPITYTWEQMNNVTATVTMPPASTNTAGPMFRSFKGTASPIRYLPRLQDVVNNVSPTWEVLNSVARTLNFRLTVRDNRMGGGCTAEDNMVVTVSGTAGPFLVTSPNTAVSWAGGSLQTITWDVASTNIAPVNCANVDVLMSVDGGLTYPFTLLVATPNDGSQVAAIPNVATTQARIMVRANGNIFYDISNANFTITTGASNFSITSSPHGQTVCKPTSAVYNLTLGSIGGFSGSVNLSATDLPAGAVATFSTNPVAVPGSTTLTILTTNAATGSFNPVVTGASGALTINRNIALTVNGLPSAPALTAPSNNALNVTTTPTLTWGTSASASTYQIQVSTSSSFQSTVIDASLTTTSFTVSSSLNGATTYFWRVRASNSCGLGAWSSVFSFATGCSQTTASTNVPVTISASGTPTVTSTLTLSGVNGNIIGFRVKDLNVHHSWVGDLRATLKSPGNVDYVLFDQPGTTTPGGNGCSMNHLLVTFDNNAAQTAAQLESTCNSSTLPTPPPHAINGTYQPLTSFAGLNGTSPNGTWTLTINDLVGGDGGSLQTWSLEIITDCNVSVQSKVFLANQSNGTMDDYLRQLQVIPLNDPYANAALPYDDSGNFTFVPAGQTATTTQTVLDNNNVVDWVFVELRTGTPGATTVAASKSALLKNDGTLINPNGTPFSFVGVTAGNYYVAIKHRNHSGFMTANTVALPTASLLNLTNGTVTFYEPNHAALNEVAPGVFVMWTGDANVDTSIDGGDVTLARTLSGAVVDEYHQADVNLDGSVDGGDVTAIRLNSGSVGQQID